MGRSARGRRRERGSGRREIVDLGDGDWYAEPSWYDILHAAGTAEEVDALERIAGRWVRSRWSGGMRWLEPACGSGRYLRVIAGRGGVAYGFDREEAMVAYARRSLENRGLRGRVWVDDMEGFMMPRGVRVDLAFNLISTIRHLMSDGAVLSHLECVSRALRPGGVYAVGMGLVSYGREGAVRDVWEGRRGRCEVRQEIRFVPPTRRGRREVAENRLRVRTPRREVRLSNRYELRSYSGEEWSRLLRRSSMVPLAVADESGREIGGVSSWSEAGVSGPGVWILGRRGD